MTYSSLTDRSGVSPKRSSREGARIDTFLVHHMASTGGVGVSEMMLGSGGRTVSSNYTILSDGTLWGIVPEEDRAWTSGAAGDGGKGAAWDRRSITVEIENETAAPDWRISQRALQTAANLLADLRRRHPITNVLGHRDLYERYGASYPTYCPGPNTVAQILALTPTAGGGGSNEEDVMNSSQEKKLDDALRFAKAAYEKSRDAERWSRWLKARIKGSVKQKSITSTVSEGRDAANWLKRRVRGSNKEGNPSVTAMLEALLEAVEENGGSRTAIMARAVELDRSVPEDVIDETPEVDEPLADEE